MARAHDDRRKGTVKKLVHEKGFGFIADTNGVEYFFHRSAAPDFDEITTGTTVEFVAAPSMKGPRAEQVSMVVPD
jgi:CspA family cold shock protein